MGPWSKPFLDRLGLGLPMGVKRGYHRHYAAKGNAVLTRPVVDDHYGFVLAPMARGIRLTSGAEFARHDARSTPVQLPAPNRLPARCSRSPRASTKRPGSARGRCSPICGRSSARRRGWTGYGSISAMPITA